MPGRFTPLNPSASLNNLVAQVNKNFAVLDNENVTKVFKKASINAVVTGRYADDRYGTLMTDDSGKRRMLMGQHPVDGHIGFWISKEGEDVITLLGG
ncbi:hypothetical protein [Mycobacteroides abscessus]|uniref:hypothetical protein n=1 Tax=Mycobacteroides abscessus TaxID=36809 RepID=UPI0009282B7E|nr:hypothetical protein [Mycobacteroides abscessus]SIC60096.1 Uncharacterised protein [Mycobacteroides abscessus subsp. abscessus]